VKSYDTFYFVFYFLKIMRDSRKSLRNVAQASDSSASDIIKDFKRKRIADGTRTTYSGPQKDIINFMREYHPGDFDENGDIIFPLNSAHVKEFFASLLKFAHNRLKHQAAENIPAETGGSHTSFRLSSHEPLAA
jgi:hypothetical protein